jgi:hypothetical protein
MTDSEAPIRKEAVVRTSANTLHEEPSPTTFNQALTTYNSALRTTYQTNGTNATLDLIEETSSTVKEKLQLALRNTDFDICTERVLESFTEHSFLDERDATTLLTQALAEEIIRLSEAETDATTHIPGTVVRYLLRQTTSENIHCADAAACVGWAIDNTKETLLLNPSGDAYGPDISSDAATQITRHALHADQYAVLSRMDTDANTEQFSDAVSLFEQDYSQNESPVPDAVVPRRVTLHPPEPNITILSEAAVDSILSRQ